MKNLIEIFVINKIRIIGKTSTIPLLFLFMLQSKAALATAQNEGSYMQAAFGIGYMPNIKANGLNIPHNIAYSPSVMFGSKFENIRYDVEFGYTHASNNGFVGSVNTFKSMLNLYYDFDKFGDNYFSGITPYIGGGAGYAHIRNATPRNPTLINDKVITTSNRFAYQAMGGFSYHLTDNITGRTYYRYFGTKKLNGTNSIYQDHTFNVAISYTFSNNI